MKGFFKKVGERFAQVGKKAMLFGAVALSLFVSAPAHAAATDIVTYNTEGGTITWDFSSILTMMFSALGAAMAAGALVWVAIKGYQLMKRGERLCAIHFQSPPYTGELARDKVLQLAKKLAAYSGGMRVYMVPFTKCQLEIHEKCPEELGTLITRRFMMRIAQRLAEDFGALALVTGESLGQVASQTMEALVCTDAVVDMPVFRPLIGMDKEEIVTIARRIDTFTLSIQPYEDCCTVFTPRHPDTRPKLRLVEAAEAALDIDGLVAEALQGIRTIEI